MRIYAEYVRVCGCAIRRFNPALNFLTPMSDQERVSPYNIQRILSRQVMRIKKNSDKGIFTRSKAKFSKLTS